MTHPHFILPPYVMNVQVKQIQETKLYYANVGKMSYLKESIVPNTNGFKRSVPISAYQQAPELKKEAC